MRKVSLVACGWALSLLPAWGQSLPEPPVNSDVAFRILPASYGTAQVETEVLKEQPLIRLVVEGGASLLGVDPVWDLLDTFDGTVLGAILSEPKKSSSLTAYFRDSRLRGEHEWAVAQMQSLVSDLESYKVDNDSYPEDYQKFIDEVRYYDVTLPDGVSYKYERTDGGKGFRLRVKYEELSELGELGPAPVFGPDGYSENATPRTPPVPLDYALAVRVKNSQAAKSIADGLWGPSEGGFWRSGTSVVATLRGSWLVVSDRQQNLGTFLNSLNGKGAGWTKNPGFARVAKNLDMNAPVAVYANLPRILKAVSNELPQDAVKMLSLLGPTGYTVTPREHFQCRMEAFVAMNPPKGSELEGFFKDSAGADPQAALVADNIPWDITNAFAADYRRSKKFFDALVALSPEAKADVETAEDVWAGFLGLDASKGFDELVDGWAIVSFERIDIFVGFFEDLSASMSALPPDDPIPDEGTGGPDSESSESVINVDGEISPPTPDPDVSEPELEPVSPDSDGDEETVDPTPAGPPKFPRLPFTVAFQVVDAQAREALTAALEKRLGEAPGSKAVHGVEVKGREDGLLSYAVRDNWFYLSGGKTQRLLRNLLAAATGQKPSLTSLESWNRFRSGQRGQVLAIGHQKVDGVYSMAKGALLFLGPDFRPLAYEIGQLRDYHSAAFVVPDGVLLVGDILRGDGK